MANGDTSPSRVGQINSAGDTDALFLKKFKSEKFCKPSRSPTSLKSLHTVRTIENGKIQLSSL